MGITSTISFALTSINWVGDKCSSTYGTAKVNRWRRQQAVWHTRVSSLRKSRYTPDHSFFYRFNVAEVLNSLHWRPCHLLEHAMRCKISLVLCMYIELFVNFKTVSWKYKVNFLCINCPENLFRVNYIRLLLN